MTFADPLLYRRDEAAAGPMVLFVCLANVCRSPAMTFLTSRALHQHGLATSWTFTSAGTTTAGEQGMCPTSAGLIRPLLGGPEFARGHRSRPLTQALVSEAALILVTSREEGSAVVRFSPQARARTFTMVEAALLSEKAVERGVRLRPDGAGRHAALLAENTGSLAAGHHLGEPGTAQPQELAEAMRANRGFLAASQPPTGLLARLTGRRLSRGLDIGDPHTGTAAHHEPVLEDLRWASTRLAESWARLSGLGA